MKRSIVLGLFLLITLPVANAEVIHRAKSLYQGIYVRDNRSQRCMQFAAKQTIVKHYQGCVYKNSKKMVFGYSEAMMSTLLMHPAPKRILVIGLGAGVIPSALGETIPNALIEVVEIDQEVVNIARKYFGWINDDSRMHTYVIDGRVFVKAATEKGIEYDIVLIDAFNSEYVPEHMMTLDFLEEVKSILSPDGVFASNTFATSQLYDHESTTYEAAFGDFFNVQMDGKSSNRVIVGAGHQMPDVEFIRTNALRYARHFWSAYEINVNDLLTNMENAKDWDTTARILTDQYSPANILAGRARLKSSWKNTFASGLETVTDEHPVISGFALLAIILSFLLLIIKFFDFIVKSRRNIALTTDTKG